MDTYKSAAGLGTTKSGAYVFSIVVIIVSLLFIILFAVNAWYWSKIYYNNTETAPVTRSEAGWLFWLNILWLFVALAIMIYGIVILVQEQKLVSGVSVSTASAVPVATTIAAPLAAPIPQQVRLCDPLAPQPLYNFVVPNIGVGA